MKSKKKVNYSKYTFIVISLVALVFLVFLLIQLVPTLHYKISNYSKNPEIISIEQSDIDILNSRYKSDVSEYVYCLYGTTAENGYIVEYMKETIVLRADDVSIRYRTCENPGNLIGTIHSHPETDKYANFPLCELSPQDIYTFGSTGNPITGVICGVDKFGIFSTNDFEKPMKMVIN